MKPIRLAPEAARELDEAADWYESRQSGLADSHPASASISSLPAPGRLIPSTLTF